VHGAPLEDPSHGRQILFPQLVNQSVQELTSSHAAIVAPGRAS